MSLSARDQRILSEIADDMAAAESRLARALTSARLPVLRRPAASRRGPQHAGAWIAAILASLLAGIALLTAGLVLDVLALAGRHPGPARADGAHPCAPRRTCRPEPGCPLCHYADEAGHRYLTWFALKAHAATKVTGRHRRLFLPEAAGRHLAR